MKIAFMVGLNIRVQSKKMGMSLRVKPTRRTITIIKGKKKSQLPSRPFPQNELKLLIRDRSNWYIKFTIPCIISIIARYNFGQPKPAPMLYGMGLKTKGSHKWEPFIKTES